MKIDLVFSPDQNSDPEKRETFFKVSAIQQAIQELTGHEARIYSDAGQLVPENYYFLFDYGVMERISEWSKYASNMVLMTGNWADMESLNREFDFLAIIHYPHLLFDHPAFFGKRKVVELIRQQLVPDYYLPGLQVEKLDSIFVSGNKEKGLIPFLVEYLEYYEKLKEVI